jgi:four helix bundle protein
MKMWNDAVDLSVLTYKYTKQFPIDERFGLVSQMNRAAVSVSSNIAEGCSRSSEIEFKRFLEIAMGSIFELETQFILANKLMFINKAELELVVLEIHQLQKQINGLISKIKQDKNKIVNF